MRHLVDVVANAGRLLNRFLPCSAAAVMIGQAGIHQAHSPVPRRIHTCVESTTTMLALLSRIYLNIGKPLVPSAADGILFAVIISRCPRMVIFYQSQLMIADHR